MSEPKMSSDDHKVAENLEYIAQRATTDRRFYGYHVSLEPTGCEPIDAVLAAVCAAGKSFHHTSEWGEGGWLDTIDHVARFAAAAVAEVAKERDEAIRDRDFEAGEVQRFARLLESEEITRKQVEARVAELEAEIERLREAIHQTAREMDADDCIAGQCFPDDPNDPPCPWRTIHTALAPQAPPAEKPRPVPSFPRIGCTHDCGFERRGIGWQCVDGTACGRYVHPGDAHYDALDLYHAKASTQAPPAQ